MLISFSVQNWKSFRDKAEFSMVASRERQHGERIPRVAKYPLRVLPITAIYGGNASGKTNFFQALGFVQGLVVKGSAPDARISVQPFLLDDQVGQQPSHFRIELLVDDLVYDFSCSLDSQAILEEKLVLIKSTSEKTLYHRHQGKPHFDRSLPEKKFLGHVFRGTRPNQLFLTNSVEQSYPPFKPLYDWFRSNLTLISPDTGARLSRLFSVQSKPAVSFINERLRSLDTGIHRLGGQEVPVDAIPGFEKMKADIDKSLKDQEALYMKLRGPDEDLFFEVKRTHGQLTASRLTACHAKADGGEVAFDLAQEAAGARRLLDLLPVSHQLEEAGSENVYVIDEMDRSLHTQLTRVLLQNFLMRCSGNSRSQLLFSTYDMQLMDQALLRRDEIWVVERDAQGASALIAFSDYKDIRYDRDLRKSYLEGRMGGVPRLSKSI